MADVYEAITAPDLIPALRAEVREFQGIDTALANQKTKNRSSGRMCGSRMRELVEMSGIEPPTPSLRTRCSSQLSYTPGCYDDSKASCERPQAGRFNEFNG